MLNEIFTHKAAKGYTAQVKCSINVLAQRANVSLILVYIKGLEFHLHFQVQNKTL